MFAETTGLEISGSEGLLLAKDDDGLVLLQEDPANEAGPIEIKAFHDAERGSRLRQERYLLRFVYGWLFHHMFASGGIDDSPLAKAFRRHAQFDPLTPALERAILAGLGRQRLCLQLDCTWMQRRAKFRKQFGLFLGDGDGFLTSTGDWIFQQFRHDLTTGKFVRRIANWNRLDAKRTARIQALRDLFATALGAGLISPASFRAFRRTTDVESGLYCFGSPELADALRGDIQLLEELRYRFAAGAYPELVRLSSGENDEP